MRGVPKVTESQSLKSDAPGGIQEFGPVERAADGQGENGRQGAAADFVPVLSGRFYSVHVCSLDHFPKAERPC